MPIDLPCYIISVELIGRVLQMKAKQEIKDFAAAILSAMLPNLNEKQQRQLGGIIASKLGYGGVSFVSSISMQSRNTIIAGANSFIRPNTSDIDGTLQHKTEDNVSVLDKRIRKPGGGRKPIEVKYPDLAEKIEEIISDDTYGNPEKPLRYTSKSLRKITEALMEKGIYVCHVVVSKTLEKLGYSKQQNQKMKQIGSQHPDRDAQFRFINNTAADFLKEGDPVISIDTKKKENIGNFKNNGSEYRPIKSPRQVLDHDFPIPELGKVVPYGVYVLNNNTGFINLGISHDTPQFAGESVYQWWQRIGKHTFPLAKRIYITCDSGGSNGSRVWLWKYYLQELANATGLEIHVSHFPPGTSKWNKIEHRLFCYISKNWQGHPLIDIKTTINLIGSTTTKNGLVVKCRLDENCYKTGIKITEEQKNTLNIVFNGPNEKWNYIIYPS